MMVAANSNQVVSDIKEYYGKTLQQTEDLKTSACCSSESLPVYVRRVLPMIEREVVKRFYGCGSPIPPLLEGKTVLDLGCGTGRDVFIASNLVGEKGRVIGVDMTEEQLEVAKEHVDAQMKQFGFAQPNVTFHHGYIEDLAALDIESDSVDVVMSNCVINLSPDKNRVFSEIFRVLRPGGELYFSDIFAGRRIPADLVNDPVIRGECLGGAMYVEDFRRLLNDLGCCDYRIVSSRSVELGDPDVKAKIGMVDFHSMTIRAFKISDLEDICEDYGQSATYLGTIPDLPHAFHLDDHHEFETNNPVRVCGNTAVMLSASRFAAHFNVTGNRSTHFGPFECRNFGTTSQSMTTPGNCC